MKYVYERYELEQMAAGRGNVADDRTGNITHTVRLSRQDLMRRAQKLLDQDAMYSAQAKERKDKEAVARLTAQVEELTRRFHELWANEDAQNTAPLDENEPGDYI